MNNTDQHQKKKKHIVREYVEALLTAAIIALFIRAFVIEAFKIPSGSMIPTLSVGDHIFVNKFIYGLRIPFTKNKFIKLRSPTRGEVIVFIYPVDESKDFIKRVVGLPGDKIEIKGTDVLVNGECLSHDPLVVNQDSEDKRLLNIVGGSLKHIPYVPDFENYNFFEEATGDVKHVVQYENGIWRSSYEFAVPEGHYFVMGDNRDNSADSREWGFVPEENIKGKAMFVWLSLDKDQGGIRWDEFGRWIK
ncbi:MAG: signal peptidase I [Deltaproteobacteria bacterium CG07_land_8_20_14_0_80_38_7]|nr:MAG: signal peptidase I [Deltaproteobacteria bacterium CG07_land_8_20_14_0_80_38_7]